MMHMVGRKIVGHQPTARRIQRMDVATSSIDRGNVPSRKLAGLGLVAEHLPVSSSHDQLPPVADNTNVTGRGLSLDSSDGNQRSDQDEPSYLTHETNE